MNANIKCTNCERSFVPHTENAACPHCGLGGGAPALPPVKITCRHCSRATFRVSANWPCPHCKMTEDASYGISGPLVRCTACEAEYSPVTATAQCPRCGH